MSGRLQEIAGWLVRRRADMPAWMNRIIDAPAQNPDGVIGRIAYRVLGGAGASNTSVPESELRVYIAPTNYSGQGYLWARALEAADPRLGARNMAVDVPGGYAFPADNLVPIAANNASTDWQKTERDAVRRFTHVLIEAERPIFGGLFGRDVAAEVEALEAAGVSVAFISHGTDIRDPREHARRTPWSPYPDDPRTDLLQVAAETNLALLERLRRPTFVSTPDLLDDVPWARWCPVVVDADRFTTLAPVLARDTARVIHASSSVVQKGSHHIEPALRPLIDSGDVDYALISGVSSDRMPGVIAEADIVLDQFRLGSYGVAACEAMAAGRIVVGHVLPAVRARIEQETGKELPIVEATPDTLQEVIRSLLADRDRAREIAAAGPLFVAAVHSGDRSARALIDGWIDPS
ncbi:hypothetical protein GCM10010458_09830 [Microbacterium luteolum]|uniref:Glycosyltransferase n=1 Tax=Microbacterium luteolum TaxID=69367 RepID=A0ABY7XRH4_MICLT|nr:glycosyltransferase [Microbacterium luteolum]WDM43743.1 glycosyltransferase [Microbacterium luteolum]